MKLVISGPIGKKHDKLVSNVPEDVKNVKNALIKLKIDVNLVLNKEVDDRFIQAIKKFQTLFFKGKPDGRIDPNGATIKRINSLSDGKAIVVTISNQHLYALSNLSEVYKFHCTTGDKDNITPKGLYKVERKYKDYTSRKYKVPMDYAMFFYKGYAIHRSRMVSATSYLKSVGIDYFGSHGCVRLEDSNSQILFKWTPLKTPVMIL